MGLDMEEKLLSIIVPAYNIAPYLAKCLDSLIIDDKVLFRKLDVIVVNDGSSDGTGKIAHDFAQKWSDVFRVMDKPNGHYGSCVNAGLVAASGFYVKILDGDDWFDAEEFQRYLQKISEMFEERRFFDMVLSDYDNVDNAGNVTHKHDLRFSLHDAIDFGIFERQLPHHIMLPCVAYRKSLLDGIGYRQSERLSYTDLEWVTYPMRQIVRIAYFPMHVYKYRIGRDGQSVEVDTFRRNIWMIVKILERMLDDYESLCGGRDEVRRYVDKVMCAQLRLVYDAYLLDAKSDDDLSPLLRLDRRLVEVVPHLYSNIGETKANSRRFDFHYIREFRREKTRSTLRFLLFDLYRKMVNKWL